MLDTRSACSFVSSRLAEVADPDAAHAMAAYMKTDMPFYGVKKPARVPILRELKRRWVPSSHGEYEALVGGLWALPHREEKYLALGVARAHDRFVTSESLPLFHRLITEGAWWDLVDEAATKLAGRVLLRERVTTTPLVRGWLDDEDMWLRRAAIICQIGHKDETDVDLLFEACRGRAHETDFFIRKAIGWALREHAKTDPDAVRHFVAEHAAELSGLSRREATKHL